MVKHIQTLRRLLLTNCLSVFDHFVGLVLKGLTISIYYFSFEILIEFSLMDVNIVNTISNSSMHHVAEGVENILLGG